MKSCPTCKRSYADDTITFCLVDGSILSAPYDPQVPRPYHHPQNEPPPTVMMPAIPRTADTIPSPYPTIRAIPAPPQSFKLEAEQSQGQKRSISKRLLPIIATVFFITIVGLIIIVSRNTWSGRGGYTSSDSTATTNASNNNIAVTSQTSATRQNRTASEAEPSPRKTENSKVLGNTDVNKQESICEVKFNGKVYRTTCQWTVENGIPIDLYYYRTPGVDRVPGVNNDQPLWNRFARVPAANHPDQSSVVWYHAFWKPDRGTWVLVGEKGVDVEFLRRIR